MILGEQTWVATRLFVQRPATFIVFRLRGPPFQLTSNYLGNLLHNARFIVTTTYWKVNDVDKHWNNNHHTNSRPILYIDGPTSPYIFKIHKFYRHTTI